MEPVPSTLGGGTFDPRRPGLRNPMQYFGKHRDTETRRNNKNSVSLYLSVE